MHFINRLIEWAHLSLLESDEAQAYLRSRGSSMDQWVRHKIGFVSSDFDVDPQECAEHSEYCKDRDARNRWCDACRYRRWSSTWENDNDGWKEQQVGRRLVGHVVLPLTNYTGNVVGFQTRSIEGKSYDTFLMNRRPEGYFFGASTAMHSIWARRSVSIVEGPFDHLVYERLIMPNVLALTTNVVNPHQLRFLRRFVRRVYMCLDRDKAGRSGKDSLIEQIGLDLELIDVPYPKVRNGDKDIGDFWKQVGDDKFVTHFRRVIV